jgi:CRP/FNR family transcriptional regulator
MSRLAELVALYPLLGDVAADLRDAMEHQVATLTVPAGAVVFDERQACQGFPFVLGGSIRVVKAAANGRELQLYRVGPGETCIISSSCLLGHAAYNARGVAETETTLALLPRGLFDDLLADAPFRNFVFHLFAERIADLMQLVEAVAFYKLDQRLAALLLGRGQLLRITHQQLADELGSVREIVTRLLRGFAGQGSVRLGREQIEVLDPAALRQLAEGR